MRVPDGHKRRAAAVLKRVTGPAIGAEIGVLGGLMSVELLKGNPDLSLLMVDSWVATSVEGISGEDCFQQAVRLTEFAGDGRTFLKMPSVLAAPLIADEYLDFVFIDADHSYEAVKADIAAWEPKVKRGGWLCGDDYPKPQHGVKQAVDEFATQSGLALELDDVGTWFIRL